MLRSTNEDFGILFKSLCAVVLICRKLWNIGHLWRSFVISLGPVVYNTPYSAVLAMHVLITSCLSVWRICVEGHVIHFLIKFVT